MTIGFSYNMAQQMISDAKKNPDNKMLKIGVLCVKTNTSVTEVAEFFGVSRQSVYGWMKGEFKPDEARLKKADKLIAKLERKV